MIREHRLSRAALSGRASEQVMSQSECPTVRLADSGFAAMTKALAIACRLSARGG